MQYGISRGTFLSRHMSVFGKRGNDAENVGGVFVPTKLIWFRERSNMQTESLFRSAAAAQDLHDSSLLCCGFLCPSHRYLFYFSFFLSGCGFHHNITFLRNGRDWHRFNVWPHDKAYSCAQAMPFAKPTVYVQFFFCLPPSSLPLMEWRMKQQNSCQRITAI